MKNYVKPGSTFTFLAAAIVASGDPVIAGGLFGIACAAYAIGDSGEASRVGVYYLAKVSGTMSLGDKLYWDVAQKKLTKTAAGNTFAGFCAADALSADDYVDLLLADAGLELSSAEIKAKLEALTGENKLSADAMKDGTTNHVFTAADDTKLANLGVVKLYVENYTVVADDDTANHHDFQTGFGAAPEGWNVQIYRAGVNVMADAVVSALGGGDTGKLRVADGGATYTMTAGDVITLMAWDKA